jgi:hypothetical protein
VISGLRGPLQWIYIKQLSGKKIRHLIKSVFIYFIFILMCFLVLRAFYDISMILAIIGVFITIYVILLQSPQLNKLTALVRETKAITEILGTNAEKEKNVKNFFPRNNEENDENKYKLFYPVDNEGKTLSLVNETDSYAMHVISDLLGVNDLELKPTARNTDNSKDLKKLLLELSNGKAIILCDGNPALRQFYDHIIRPDTLPCWFESYENEFDVNNKYKNSKSIRIAVKETSKMRAKKSFHIQKNII